MRLRERLEDLEVGLMGNRLSLFGNTFMIGGLANYIYGGSIEQQILGLTGASFGFCFSGPSFCGISTLRAYRATKKHIELMGRIDDRFVEGLLGVFSNNPIYGYCQLQGAYLAARKYGLGREFREIKKRVSRNKIPNF